MSLGFDRFARVSALRPAMQRARLASAVTGAQAAPSRTDSRAGGGADALAALLGGALDRNHFGEHFLVRRWYAQPEPCPPLNGALHLLDPRAPRLAANPARWLFLDTETTGLAGGTGTYAFLVGLAWWDSAGLQVEQFFLRDFDDEHSMLAALAARMAERPVLVTFNGKSFDWPLLETRYRMTRSIRPPEPAAHLDLLHPARHIWRLRLGSVRLCELERAVLGAPSPLADWNRSRDVRSEMIPHIYFQFLRGGSPVPLLDVFRHNQMDLRGLAAIAVKLASLLDAPESADASPLDLYGLSRLLRRRSAAPQSAARSRRLCERALASGLPAGLDRAALRDLAALAKRQRDFSRACSLWLQLAGIAPGAAPASPGLEPQPAPASHPERSQESAFPAQTPGPQPLAPSLDAIHALEQLAMHYEHRARDPHRALDYARLALGALRPAARAGLLTPAQAARLRARLDRRLARLERSLGCRVSPRSSASAPLSVLSASALSFSVPGPGTGIARTPLRRASKRTPAESNGHAQIPRR